MTKPAIASHVLTHTKRVSNYKQNQTFVCFGKGPGKGRNELVKWMGNPDDFTFLPRAGIFFPLLRKKKKN